MQWLRASASPSTPAKEIGTGSRNALELDTRPPCTERRRDARRYSRTLVAPEILEPRRRQLCVTHGMLDRSMPKPILDRPRIVPCIRQGEAAGVAQHVAVDREQETGTLADVLHSPVSGAVQGYLAVTNCAADRQIRPCAVNVRRGLALTPILEVNLAERLHGSRYLRGCRGLPRLRS
jgi:hypothetical protein